MPDQVQISFLDFPENVRMRTSMYLMNPNHCVQEIVDNAVDEYFAGYCDTISVFCKNDSISVSDNGRGIPTDPATDPKFKGWSQLRQALGSLHSGGKISEKAGSYKTITGGLNGVGASCVNAVSSDFKAVVYKNSKAYAIEFKQGKLVQDITVTDTGKPRKHGTTITFTLDPEIWKDETIDYVKLRSRMKQIAYLNPGLTIQYVDAEHKETFNFPDGIQTYLRNLTTKDTLCDDIVLQKKENDISVNLGFVYTDVYTQTYYTFVNNVETTRAGDHLTGFKTGIVKSIQAYVKDNQIKGCDDLTSDDCLEGVIAIISVKVKDPKFEGQGKTAVRMPELRSAVSEITKEAFYEYLSKNPKTAKAILAKLQQAAKARLAAKKARQAVREQKNKLQSISLPGKLTACSSRKPEECEIFLVEGDSAGGSAIQGRDPKTQAVLPVFGKILNAEKGQAATILSSAKILDAVKALGCGLGKDLNLEKLKYHKIIIMADAD